MTSVFAGDIACNIDIDITDGIKVSSVCRPIIQAVNESAIEARRTMAKKKSSRKKTTASKASKPVKGKKTTPESSQFALRLRPELYEQLRDTAEEARISMNQLIQGLCEACIENAHLGEASVVPGEDGIFTAIEEAGCLFFGPKTGEVYTTPKGKMTGSQVEQEYGVQYLEDEFGHSKGIDHIGFRANIWFGLDYSGRGYRRY